VDYLLRITDPRPELLLLDEGALVGCLRQLIEEAHDTGLGPLIGGIWLWDEKDIRHELTLLRIGETPEGDWTDWEYVLFRAGQKPDIRFRVSVREGR
jgi:hypothetical protein